MHFWENIAFSGENITIFGMGNIAFYGPAENIGETITFSQIHHVLSL
jgi:hypothetical protein